MPFQKNKSIEDSLRLLLEIAGEHESCGSRELSRRLDMEPTRINRFLKTLLASGFIEQGEDQRYYSGPGMQVLSAQCIFGSKLLRASLPVIEDIFPNNHVVGLGVLHRDQVSYLFHALPGTSLAEGIGRLHTYPATISSIGLMLLALKPEEYVKQLYSDTHLPYYSGSREELYRNLQQYKSQGYSLIKSYEKNDEYTMAMPINSSMGALAFAKIKEKQVESKLIQLKEITKQINTSIKNGIKSEIYIELENAV